MNKKHHGAAIALPPCGMLYGSCIYIYPKDYLFQSSGWFAKWVPEDRHPLWYLDKVVEDNQGNLAVLFDGGASDQALKSMAFWHDMEGIGLSAPEPDWENRKNLVPEDWPEIRKHSERYGAGALRFVKEAAQKKLYSFFVYSQARPQWLKKANHFGKWFLGLNIGESFSIDIENACHTFRAKKNIPAMASLEGVRDSFQRSVERLVRNNRRQGWPRIIVTNASFAADYEVAGGVDLLLPEDFAFNHLNVTTAFARGLARQTNSGLWGSFFAHEHYSFLPYASPYKFSMLRAALYLKYLSGSKIMVLESGNWWQQTVHVDDTKNHEVPKPNIGGKGDVDPREAAPYVKEARKYYRYLGYHSKICKCYRKEVSDFYDFLKAHGTPPGQPETTIAVVKGRLDGAAQEYNPNTAVWGAYAIARKNPLWYEGAPERGWDIMKNVFFPRRDTLGEFKNKWFSGTPYGMVDIVSMNVPLTAQFLIKHYKVLIFLGWNTATDEQYNLLKTYVRSGGKLFIGIPHLRSVPTRNYSDYPVTDLLHKGDFSDLCGVRVKGRGLQYFWAMILREKNALNLPKNKHYGIYCTHMGNIEYAKGVEVIAVDDETFIPILTRYRCGKGEVYFLNSWQYPGALMENTGPGATTRSKGLVGEVLQKLARDCRGRVYITDDGANVADECEYIAYSYFPSNGKTYLLNVDADRVHKFFLHKSGKEKRMIRLKPFEFKVL